MHFNERFKSFLGNLLGTKSGDQSSDSVSTAEKKNDSMAEPAIDPKEAVIALESIAKGAKSLETTATIRDSNGNEFLLTVMMNEWHVQGYPLEAGAKYPDMSGRATQSNAERPFQKRYYRGLGSSSKWSNTSERLYTFSEILTYLANGLPDSTLLVDTITVKGKGASVKGAALKAAAIEAWCQAVGIEVPTAQELKAAKADNKERVEQQRKEIEELLRTGQTGIAEWNSKAPKSRAAFDLQNMDLSGADLSNLNLSALDISSSNFSSANLTGTKFSSTTAKNCNFNNAIVHNSDWNCANVSGSSFENADFNGVKGRPIFFNKCKMTNARFAHVPFDYAQIKGADFTGALFDTCTFKDMSFDGDTILPDDFKFWDSLRFEGTGVDPRKMKVFNESHSTESLNFESFLERLGNTIDKERLKKSLSMLKKESFELFSEVTGESVNGIVKSQTDPDLVYSCRLTGEGQYYCCTQNLNVCGGLRGAICKHILVLIVGLAKANELDPNKADRWARASLLHKQKLDKDIASETFLKYKGAEAGEIDWRPTETTPEDFYAF